MVGLFPEKKLEMLSMIVHTIESLVFPLMVASNWVDARTIQVVPDQPGTHWFSFELN